MMKWSRKIHLWISEIVITAIMTKRPETKRRKKKPAKHSFEFMIVDAKELSF